MKIFIREYPDLIETEITQDDPDLSIIKFVVHKSHKELKLNPQTPFVFMVPFPEFQIINIEARKKNV